MFGKKRETMHVNAVKGSAVRAKYIAHSASMHKIEFTFVTEDNKTIVIEMEHETAAELMEQGIAAHSAIQRPIQFPRNVPFG